MYYFLGQKRRQNRDLRNFSSRNPYLVSCIQRFTYVIFTALSLRHIAGVPHDISIDATNYDGISSAYIDSQLMDDRPQTN